ncbi:hypothetical protein, unlikely [Trypanosoma brucei brucei TREU927]|uniref:T. brucei spp.-specific protein n=1 Tax=Trypanosoma brucei brucei (strain 927/4 GUTat10.1) TaxID=185431 RepID=Q38CU6_TRYB2|nr:hypothetical protein, unlikely [Trypanosoma brucei brucei TREU927]EAN77374.1 hypothetical protein, unlikely [Trypanosoma brucei brucei TREU927]
MPVTNPFATETLLFVPLYLLLLPLHTHQPHLIKRKKARSADTRMTLCDHSHSIIARMWSNYKSAGASSKFFFKKIKKDPKESLNIRMYAPVHPTRQLMHCALLLTCVLFPTTNTPLEINTADMFFDLINLSF